MFVDFNRVFKNKSQAQITVPKTLVTYMNKSLPEGVKYIVDDNGNCVITSEGKSYSIGGFVFRPNEEQKKILGKNFTHEDVVKFLYNTQKPIPLTLKKDGYITLNGQEFPIDKMSYNPLNPVKHTSETLFMYPHPFPKPFLLTIGCNKYERKLLISQVPNNSVNISAFESSKNEPLILRYLIDDNTHCITLSLSYNLKNAKSIRDIVESTMIYNAFLDGEGLLMGQPLDVSIDEDGANRFDDNSAIFWEKVLKVEEVLDVEFTPLLEDVDFDTVCLVEQLYQNLINKVPIRENQAIESIDGKWNSKSNEKDINESIGKPIYFQFEATTHIDLFGVKKELPSFIGVVNAVLSEYNIKGKKQRLILTDESPEKQRYTSTICFKNEKELKEFKSIGHDQIIALFKDAKKPQEYNI